MPRPSTRPVKLYNHAGKFKRYISGLQAERLLASGNARDLSRWVHGKGRTDFEVQMAEPDRQERHSPCALTPKEMLTYAGANPEATPAYENYVKAKVAIWGTTRVRWSDKNTGPVRGQEQDWGSKRDDGPDYDLAKQAVSEMVQ